MNEMFCPFQTGPGGRWKNRLALMSHHSSYQRFLLQPEKMILFFFFLFFFFLIQKIYNFNEGPKQFAEQTKTRIQ